MSTARLALLLHPARMRLVNALSAGRALTTSELGERLPDLPQATVYRQVGLLVRGGIFEVESERRVRGVVERRYRLARTALALDPDAVRAMSREDHRRGFTAGMAALLAEFNAYLDHGSASPPEDGVSYKQFTLWLTPRERARLIRQLRRILTALVRNQPGGGRVPYLLSPIFFPSGAGREGPERKSRPAGRRRR